MLNKKNNRNRINKIQKYVSNFLRLTLFFAIIVGIIDQRWDLIFITTIILVLTYLPFFIEKKYGIDLPLEFEFFIILFIYSSLFLGEVRNYYIIFWWWDIILHMGFAIAIGFAGFMILYTLYYKNKIKANPSLIAFFSFCFAVAIGASWEIFEFSMDQIIGTNMQKTGLADTMWDLIVNFMGAFIISFIGYFYLKGKKTPIFNRILIRFIKDNPRYFKDENKHRKNKIR